MSIKLAVCFITMICDYLITAIYQKRPANTILTTVTSSHGLNTHLSDCKQEGLEPMFAKVKNTTCFNYSHHISLFVDASPGL